MRLHFGFDYYHADDDDNAAFGFCLGWYLHWWQPWLTIGIAHHRLFIGWLPCDSGFEDLYEIAHE